MQHSLIFSHTTSFQERSCLLIWLTVWKHALPRINQGAIKATVELLRLFVVQARARAEGEAAAEGDDVIRPEHVEAAMPELFADF